MTASSNMHVINLAIRSYIWWLMSYLKSRPILRVHVMINAAETKSIVRIWTHFQSLIYSSYTWQGLKSEDTK